MTSAPDFVRSSPPQFDGQGGVLELAISPTGRVHLERLPGNSDLPPAAAARIAHAFERGSSHGLLHLGAVELATWLPSSLAFGRELAHLFMAQWGRSYNLTTFSFAGVLGPSRAKPCRAPSSRF